MTASLPGAAPRRATSCALDARIATGTPRLESHIIRRLARAAARRGAVAGVVASLLLAACGGGGSDGGSSGGPPGGPPGSTPSAADYFPLGKGDRWLYHETWNGGDDYFQVDVGGHTTQDGHDLTALVYTTVGGVLLDNRTYAVDATGVKFYPDPSDEVAREIGPNVIVPARTAVGSSMVLVDKSVIVGDVDADGLDDSLRLHAELEVMGIEPVTTPAGTFGSALRAHIDQTDTIQGTQGKPPVVFTTSIDEWFVAGVGRVRFVSTTTGPGGVVDVDTVELVAWRTAARHGGPQPVVTGTVPDSDTTQRNAAEVSATFNMPMDGASLDAGGFRVVDAGGQAVAGHVALSSDGGKATFVPDAGWRDGRFTASISAGALDRYGNAVTPAAWSFAFDVVAPTIASTTPADLARVDYAAPLVIRFSEPLASDPIAVLGGQAVAVTDDATGALVDVTQLFDGVATFTLTPKLAWTHGHDYTVAFADSLGDIVGNPLGAAGILHFSVDAGRFESPVAIADGAGLQGVAIGDVDGDGRNDVVYATIEHRVYLRKGGSGGTLSASTLLFDGPQAGCDLGDVVIADVDGDGRRDIVAGSYGCGARLLLQDALGGFVVDGRMGGLLGRIIRVVDLNGDGRPDIAGFDFYEGFVRIAKQDAGGTFACCDAVSSDVWSYMGMDVADVDGDGRVDLVASGYGGIAVMRQQADGTFASTTLPGGEPAPNGADASVGDLNGDGRKDIFATGGYWGDSFSSNVLYRQEAGGSFGSSGRPGTSTIGPAAHVRLADMDGDGRLDAVVAHGDGSVGLYVQRADGTLGTEDLYPVAGDSASLAMAVGDVTGDGRHDVIVGNFLLAASSTPSQSRTTGRSGAFDRSLSRVHGALAAHSRVVAATRPARSIAPAGAR